MKKSIVLTLFVLCSLAIVWAQEGEIYRGLKEVVAKEYEISQSFGQNKMKLSQVKTGYYDKNGSLQNWVLQKANLSYMGQVKLHRSHDASEQEILTFDAMNKLIGRKYERQGPGDYESNSIEYDAKGKLLNKKRSRYHLAAGDKWSFAYNQVGYTTAYSQTAVSPAATLEQEYEYDYFDEPTAIHYYTYLPDGSGRLQEMLSTDPEGKLLKRVEYHYDDAGLLGEEKSFGEDELPVGGIRYTYDSSQRLIQSLEYRFNPRYGGVFEATKQCDYSYSR